LPVYAGYILAKTKRALRRKEEPSYQGTFTGARKYVLQTFATTQSAMMKRRVAQCLSGTECPACRGKRLQPGAPSITFGGTDISESPAAVEATWRASKTLSEEPMQEI
jgi:excinuclease ABC subunit A